ncbi:hypothetical protein [Paraliomyxa miuraensis]|uniref:hypothetical protein n=1 Tax=Paraliomyxa miuraensis TaxID=376150 RepID=UPI00225475C9|nr:hypothetical protein [Paraliomyxa miuraensis]MCX4247260.1 hypothetical protein [Paraliomyxa miuraensis]
MASITTIVSTPALGLLLALATIACGDDGSATTDDDPTGATSATSSSPTSSPSTTADPTTNPTTTASTTSSDPSTSADDGSTGPTGACVQARLLWFEDFENGDYDRWTSNTYGADWGGPCDYNELSMDRAVSGSWSNRSEITCVTPESHRGYGGLQFDGDDVVEAYTNTGSGIDAPHGVINTYWSWLEVPYPFENGRWFSPFTVNNACDWSDNVITLGLEDPSNRITPAHVLNTGGTVTFAENAPSFPLGQWVRTTIYVNYHEGRMHVWQDGAELVDATFSRSDTDLCQWHWGMYASGDNDDIVLYEDDNSLWKLEEPWVDFTVEPWLGHSVMACE